MPLQQFYNSKTTIKLANVLGCGFRLIAPLVVVSGLCLIAIFGIAVAKDKKKVDLFPTDRVLDVQITVSEKDWDTIRNQSRNIFTALQEKRKLAPVDGPYTYVTAKMTIDGVEYPEVGLRKKGFIGSQNTTRPSLKVKLNYVHKKTKIGGLTNLTFNNNQQDTTQMSQFMGYALFNAVGSPAPRCGYAKITVNGTNLGIYAHVESAQKPLLKRGFGTSRGTFYEGTVVDFYEGWEGSFEKKTGKDKRGRAKIKQLIKALQGEEGETLLSSKAEASAWVPTSGEYGDQWTAAEFDDSSWKEGRNGAGFETETGYEELISDPLNFADEMYNKTASLYLRLPFKIDNLDDAVSSSLLLRMKYDDGFVAYLNGHKVATANAPESPQWDSKATGGHDDGAAKQFASFDISEHKDKLRTGRNVLAIHGLNIDEASTDMLMVAEIQSSDYDAEKAIGELVDMDSFYKFWAVEGLLGFWDGYTANNNNFFIYLNPKTDKFHFLPWGGDCMFEKFSKLRVDRRAPLSVKTKGLVAHKLYQVKSVRERYLKTLNRIMDKHWDEETLLAETRRIEAMLKPHLAPSQVEGAKSDRVREFIRNRRADIVKETAEGMPIWTSAPSEPPLIPAGRGLARGGRRRGGAGRGEPRPDADTIWTAAKRGNTGALKQHLAKGTSVNAKDESGGTPLSSAALAGQAGMVRYLIENGADVNLRTGDANTALHGAAFLGRTEIVELLIENKANVNATNRRGETPLNSASAEWNDQIQGFVQFIAGAMQIKVDLEEVQVGRPKVAAILKKNGGKLAADLTNPKGNNIWSAAKSGDVDALKKSLAAGADINGHDDKGITPLAWAAMANQTKAVELIIKQGGKVNGKNRDGNTPLHGAAFLGRTEIVELLIKHKVDVNAKNAQRETALGSVAAEWNETTQGFVQLIARALELKVDIEQIKAARPKVAELLRKHGGKTGEELR